MNPEGLGELTPVKLRGNGVEKLVSLETTEPPEPLPQTQLELEARVGIEPTVLFHAYFTRFYWLF